LDFRSKTLRWANAKNRAPEKSRDPPIFCVGPTQTKVETEGPLRMMLFFTDNHVMMQLFHALEIPCTHADGNVTVFGAKYQCYEISKMGKISSSDRVIVVNHNVDNVPSNVYVAKSVDELEQLMELEFTPQAKQKIQQRIFVEEVVEKMVRPSLKVKRHRTVDCVSCLSTGPSVLFQCGHECMCEVCADRWMTEKAECPMCKDSVVTIIKM